MIEFLDIHTVSDVHFTGKDVIYIVSLLVTLLTAWFKLKLDNEKQNDKIKTLSQKAEQYKLECKEEFINAKKGRSQIRKDFDANITSNNKVFSNRLDKIDKEIKEINQTTNKMNNNITSIETKLDIIINREPYAEIKLEVL